MAKVTAEQYAEKWGRRLKGATSDISAGIDRVREAPGERAARAKDLMRQRLLEALDDGTWETQVAAVTLEDWKRAAKEKGVQRIAAGVDGSMASQRQMAGRLLAAVDEAVAEANQTPRGSLENNIERMTRFVRAMSQRKLRRPGS